MQRLFFIVRYFLSSRLFQTFILSHAVSHLAFSLISFSVCHLLVEEHNCSITTSAGIVLSLIWHSNNVCPGTAWPHDYKNTALFERLGGSMSAAAGDRLRSVSIRKGGKKHLCVFQVLFTNELTDDMHNLVTLMR